MHIPLHDTSPHTIFSFFNHPKNCH
jgi:hypothetical protein